MRPAGLPPTEREERNEAETEERVRHTRSPSGAGTRAGSRSERETRAGSTTPPIVVARASPRLLHRHATHRRLSAGRCTAVVVVVCARVPGRSRRTPVRRISPDLCAARRTRSAAGVSAGAAAAVVRLTRDIEEDLRVSSHGGWGSRVMRGSTHERVAARRANRAGADEKIAPRAGRPGDERGQPTKNGRRRHGGRRNILLQHTSDIRLNSMRHIRWLRRRRHSLRR